MRLAGRLVVNVLYVFFKFFANKDNADFIKTAIKSLGFSRKSKISPLFIVLFPLNVFIVFVGRIMKTTHLVPIRKVWRKNDLVYRLSLHEVRFG